MLFFTLIALILVILDTTLSDISHFLPTDFSAFPQYPYQVAFPQPLSPHPTLPSLYGPPQSPAAGGYPDPLPPAGTTHSPVAPTSSTTEFLLPEIIENRSIKDRINFIPLQSQYLPPQDRPHYESPGPKPPNQGGSNIQHHHPGYYYPRPTSTTTTTTERSSPIVVVEPDNPLPPFQGYDYNVPPPVPAVTVTIRPPTPAPVYLPPPALIASNGLDTEEIAIVEHTDASNPLRLRVKDMRCLQQQSNLIGYFRATLKIDSFITAMPTVDNDSNDKRCEVKFSRSHVVIDISADDFTKCGIYSCGKDFCLRLRFPAIRGMRTGEDAILTLHCKSQERIAIKTHALKVGVSNDIQARNIGTYAHGGVQNPLRTQIELLRRSQNGFTRHLESNGAVQLGEDLLLRAHVVPGDGWNYTKLSDVSLQRVSLSGELLNSANLITSNGCVNPSMQSICSQPPTFDPPLGYKLHFKAVMFQGMHSGEELVMSMRITACLEQHDCYNPAHGQCSNGHFGSLIRQKRDIGSIRKANNNTEKPSEISEISRISFRVIMDEMEMKHIGKDGTAELPMVTLGPRILILVSSLGFVALLTCLGVIAAWKLNQ